ncbi:MAG: GNAT family N-acetyltransferase, partial [Asgard group archaeon]|nr:GNAT family N-acetyltransferase [Asgard group archaeon]
MKISIRKALPKDLKQLEIISNKAFPNEDVFLIVNSMIDAKHFYIAEDNEMGKIIGFIIFGIYSTKIAHIYILAIEPEYHRKGIGTILL